MRFAIIVTALFTLPTLLAAAGCSDGGSAPSKPLEAVPDAAVTVPPLQDAQPPVTFVVTGNGSIISEDRSVVCGIDAGACTAQHFGITIYAVPNVPWSFDHWEPSMLHNPSMYLRSWTAPKITAVFVPNVADGG